MHIHAIYTIYTYTQYLQYICIHAYTYNTHIYADTSTTYIYKQYIHIHTYILIHTYMQLHTNTFIYRQTYINIIHTNTYKYIPGVWPGS
jgi:hypothetical protein